MEPPWSATSRIRSCRSTARDSPLAAVLFYELIQFRTTDPAAVVDEAAARSRRSARRGAFASVWPHARS